MNILDKFINFLIGTQFHLSILGIGLGTALGGASVLGGLFGGGSGGLGGTPQVDAIDPQQLAQQGIDVRRNLFEQRQGQRQFQSGRQIQQGVSEVGSALGGIQGLIGQQILPGIAQQRQQLFQGDLGLLQQAAPGLFGAQDIAGQLQQQALQELQLGGQLSPEDIRATEQQISSAVESRGRGAGAFAVGQLALGREGARRSRKAERRGFAQQAGLFGLQAASPIQDILAANRQQVGGPLQQLGAGLGFAQQFAPQTSLFDPTIVNLAQQTQGLRAGAAGQGATQRQGTREALIGGGLNLLTGGGLGGGGGFGGGFLGG